MRRAKILCTLGPSSSSEKVIESLILAGMDLVRLNFSHGDHDFYRALVNRVRSVAGRLGKQVGILQDLQGPKIRTRRMKDDAVVLRDGEKTIITIDDIEGTAERFGSQYLGLPKDVGPGDLILLDDGKLAVRCLFVEDDRDIHCEVVHGGILRSNKGINVPTGGLSTSSMTEKDVRDLHFGADVGVDAVALSFVRKGEDIRQLRKELAMGKSRPLVFAKIEKPQAVENLEEIIDECDGLMVARGDLGVELPLEQVPTVQKHMVDRAIARGKIVIVATQMLESMITEARPTRAEVSDVANAVLDGADILMLSAETASGQYPVETVKTMERIVSYTEASERTRYWRTQVALTIKATQYIQNALSMAAVHACEELDAKALVIYTTSGSTARLVSGYRPKSGIIAFVPTLLEQRRLCFAWGVESEIIAPPTNTESLIQHINNKIIERGSAGVGEKVVLITKVPLSASQRTNTIHVHVLEKARHA